MPLAPNPNPPVIMHIDLNSCFARTEQQANPLLRGKSVGVAAYESPGGCVVSPSVEAKRLGVRVGMNVREARMLAPGIVIRQSDPHKYRHVHRQFCRIYRDYSPDVTPKSIDEGVIDLSHTPVLSRKTPVEVALEIKARMRAEIGEWISCSVGIGTNRFLAKVAAGLDKPNGLATVRHTDLEELYGCLDLLDLPGINVRYRARLNASGIFTPLEFYRADATFLSKQVFKSVLGHHWHLRLRGWEVDDVLFARKSVGHAYALRKKTCDPRELSRLLMKLCEKVGRRMRGMGYRAYGVDVAFVYADRSHWHLGRKFHSTTYTNQEIFAKAMYLLNCQPAWKPVSNLAVSTYALESAGSEQGVLFDDDVQRRRKLSDAIDRVNDKYGEFCIVPALMLGMEDTILDRVAFGSQRDLEEVYGD